MLNHHGYLSTRLHKRRSDAGVTLIEIVVSIAILAIIAAPLALSLASAFRVTEETRSSLTASTNRELLGSWFTRDVSSVDAAGASVSSTRTCQGPTYTTADTLFVNLNRTRLQGSTSVIDRTSYWVQGTGRLMRIVRTSCTGISVATATAAAPVTGGTERVVADEIGLPGRSASATVRGPDSVITGHTAASLTPCDEFKCTMVIRGRFVYEIQAQRRVFGVGVPLEVGQLYSSSYSVDQIRGVRYSNTDVNGNPSGQELKWNNVLSLPVGLDTKPDLNVQFQVQSSTSGKWLTAAGTFTSATAVSLNGDDSTGQWKLALPIANVDSGGEYLVKTLLTPNGQPTKQYGGTNGFPMWFDWKPDASVFINGGSSGNDNNDPLAGGDAERGLKVSKPVKTIAKGMEIARLNSRPMILINGGPVASPLLYTGNINVKTTTSGNNRTFVGGLNDKWLRLAPPDTGGRTRSNGAFDTAALQPSTGMVIDGAKGITVRQLSLRSGGHAPNNTDPLLWSTYGMRIVNGATAKVDRSVVVSDAAGSAPGSNATGGSVGASACNGADGINNRTTDLPFPCGDQGTRTGGYGGAAGFGTNSSCGFPWYCNGAPGGNGGGGAAGGAGGSRGGCVTTAGIGKKGVGGTGGAAGSGGSQGGGTPPSASNAGLTPGLGGNGGNGGDGGGGSGSGGGGANCWDPGAGGAAGGGGGGGGTGGAGGRGGGNSIGIYLFDSGGGVSGGVVSITNTDIATNQPGQGQKGGAGGTGTVGGAGGKGGATCLGGDSSGAGGGAGGGGGGGGAGGPSGSTYGIWTNKSSGEDIFATNGNYFSLWTGSWLPGQAGSAGAAGPGGTAGNKADHMCGLIRYQSDVGGTGGTGTGGNAGSVGSDGDKCSVWFGGTRNNGGGCDRV